MGRAASTRHRVGAGAKRTDVRVKCHVPQRGGSDGAPLATEQSAGPLRQRFQHLQDLRLSRSGAALLLNVWNDALKLLQCGRHPKRQTLEPLGRRDTGRGQAAATPAHAAAARTRCAGGENRDSLRTMNTPHSASVTSGLMTAMARVGLRSDTARTESCGLCPTAAMRRSFLSVLRSGAAPRSGLEHDAVALLVGAHAVQGGVHLVEGDHLDDRGHAVVRRELRQARVSRWPRAPAPRADAPAASPACGRGRRCSCLRS